MAKPKGRTPWTVKLAPDVLTRLAMAVDAPGAVARDVYVAYNLQSLGLGFSTFEHWVARRRRGRQQRATSEASSAEHAAPMPRIASVATSAAEDASGAAHATALRTSIAAMQRMLDAGLVKPGKLPDYVRSLVAMHKLDLDQAAETRAAELHEQKLAELRKEQAAALAQVQERVRLSNEQLAEIRSKVLGL